MRPFCFAALYHCVLTLLFHIVFYMIGYDINRRYQKMNYPFATINTKNMGWWHQVCILPKDRSGNAFLVSFEIQKYAALHWIVVTICVLVFWTVAFLFSSISRDHISTIFLFCFLVDVSPFLFYLSCVYWQINHVITVSKGIERITTKQLQKHIIACQKSCNFFNPNDPGYNITEKNRFFWVKKIYTIAAPADNRSRQAIYEVATITTYRYCSTEITRLKPVEMK